MEYFPTNGSWIFGGGGGVGRPAPNGEWRNLAQVAGAERAAVTEAFTWSASALLCGVGIGVAAGGGLLEHFSSPAVLATGSAAALVASLLIGLHPPRAVAAPPETLSRARALLGRGEARPAVQEAEPHHVQVHEQQADDERADAVLGHQEEDGQEDARADQDENRAEMQSPTD